MRCQRCRSRYSTSTLTPVAVSDVLGSDPLLGVPVRRSPGRRVPGSVDGRRTRLPGGARPAGLRCRRPYPRRPARRPPGRLDRSQLRMENLRISSPGQHALAEAALEGLGIPARRETLRTLARLLAGGEIVLDPGSEREDVERRLLELCDRSVDRFVRCDAGAPRPRRVSCLDLGVRKALALANAGDRRSIGAVAERWRPWRAYATQHLWASLGDEKDQTAKGEVVA